MSDAARQNLKISREGIVLIKSFEGFRPRAIQRAEGGWIIGYGHTLSAREGATVSEADAELLLRYDLLPVEASVNDTVPGALNQHQFDALVSFAFSVGVDRFAASDVRQRLTAGSPGEAADAMMGWPEPALPEAALRRRAAERALFVANPGAPVALSDLLSAPLPPPAVVVPTFAAVPVEDAPAIQDVPTEPAPAEDTPVEAAQTETLTDAEPTPVAEDAPTAVDPRGAAVAALLGEPAARLVQDETDAEPAAQTPAANDLEEPAPSNDNPPAEAVTEEAAPAEPSEAAASTEAETASVEPTGSDDVVVQPTEETTPDEPAVETAAPEDTPADTSASEDTVVEAPVEAEADAPTEPTPDAAPANPASGWAAARYAPYGLAMVGPLPYLDNATPKGDPVAEAPAIDHAVVETALPPVEQPTTPEAEVQPEPETVVAFAPAQAVTDTAPVEAVSAEPEPVAPLSDAAPVEPMVYVPPVASAPATELVLTPLDDAPEPAVIRPLWTAEERDAPDGSETNLFGEDLTLTLGGSVMRHEMEFEAPARFDWKDTAPFIFMGGVGLVSFGASMAAFRRAAEQSGGSELTIIGWVLALIGLGCVGVSSVNLYRKFGLPGGD
ncbi:glycoside hydrolase family protein [Brevundimonas staleyi]|uniref:Lysozyme n=1 Tax=Brevundimonas staleyi TaxID=74326 RepID=A0ABW0FSG9_9CAUL